MNKKIILWVFVFIFLIGSVFGVYDTMIYNHTFQDGDDWNDNRNDCTGGTTIDGYTGLQIKMTGADECYKDITDITSGIVVAEFEIYIKSKDSTGGHTLFGFDDLDEPALDGSFTLQPQDASNVRFVREGATNWQRAITTGTFKYIWKADMDNDIAEIYENGTLINKTTKFTETVLKSFGYDEGATGFSTEYIVKNLYICNVTSIEENCTITSTNNAPVWDIGNLSTNEDTDIVEYNLTDNVTDADSDPLNFSIVSEDTSEADCEITNETALLNVTLAINFNGQANCTISADDGTDQTEEVIYIDVTAVNDAPTITWDSLYPTNNTKYNNETLEFYYNVTDVDGNSEVDYCEFYNNTDLHTNNTAPSTDNTSTYFEFNTSSDASNEEINFTLTCYDTNLTSDSKTKTLVIDRIEPVHSWTNPLSDDSTIINPSENITLNITLNDDNLYIYTIKAYDSSSNVVWNNSGNIIGNTSYNINHTTNSSLWGAGQYEIELISADSHTKNKIKDWKVEKINDKTLEFNDEVQFILNETPGDFNYTKETDRYTFDVETTVEKKQVHFSVISTEYIDIITSGEYKDVGHLVTGDYWIDFSEYDIKKVDITRISNTHVEVDVKVNNPKKKFKFKSIGGLNENAQNVTLTINTAPPSPGGLSPSGSTIDSLTGTTLSWSSVTDTDGDSITYEVFLGLTDTTMTSLGTTTSTSINSGELTNDKTHYWVVEADDGYESTNSTIVNFFVSSSGTEVVGGGGGGGSTITETTTETSGESLEEPTGILPNDDAVDANGDGDYLDPEDDYDGDGIENQYDFNPYGDVDGFISSGGAGASQPSIIYLEEEPLGTKIRSGRPLYGCFVLYAPSTCKKLIPIKIEEGVEDAELSVSENLADITEVKFCNWERNQCGETITLGEGENKAYIYLEAKINTDFGAKLEKVDQVKGEIIISQSNKIKGETWSVPYYIDAAPHYSVTRGVSETFRTSEKTGNTVVVGGTAVTMVGVLTWIISFI